MELFRDMAKSMFAIHRERIICRQPPHGNLTLFKQTISRVSPAYVLWVTIGGAEIFTRQPDGKYWWTGVFTLANGTRVPLTSPRYDFQHFMDLAGVHTFEYIAPDSSWWDETGKPLEHGTLSCTLHINDRKCDLPLLKNLPVSLVQQ